MTSLQSRAIPWTAQDIVGLYCIRFSPVCIWKARVLRVQIQRVRMLRSPPLLLLPVLESGCDSLWLQILTLITQQKMAWRDRALCSTLKLSAFSCAPTSSSLSEMSEPKLDDSNSSNSGKLSVSLPLLLLAIIVNITTDTHVMSRDCVCSTSAWVETVWVKISTVYRFLYGLLFCLKCVKVSGKCTLTQSISLLFQFCTESVPSHDLNGLLLLLDCGSILNHWVKVSPRHKNCVNKFAFKISG